MAVSRSWIKRIKAAQINIKEAISKEVKVDLKLFSGHTAKVTSLLEQKEFEAAYDMADQALSYLSETDKHLSDKVKLAANKVSQLYQIYIYLDHVTPREEEQDVQPSWVTKHLLALIELIPPQLEKAYQIIEIYRNFHAPEKFEVNPVEAKEKYLRKLEYDYELEQKKQGILELNLKKQVEKFNALGNSLGFSQSYLHLTKMIYDVNLLNLYRNEELNVFFNKFKEEYFLKKLKEQVINKGRESKQYETRMQACLDNVNRANHQVLECKAQQQEFKREIAQLKNEVYSPTVASIPVSSARSSSELDIYIDLHVKKIRRFLDTVPAELYYDKNREIKEDDSTTSRFKTLERAIKTFEKYKRELKILYLKDAIEAGYIPYILNRLKSETPEALFNSLPSTRVEEGDLSGIEDIKEEIKVSLALLKCAKVEVHAYEREKKEEDARNALEEKQRVESERLRIEAENLKKAREKQMRQEQEDKSELTTFCESSSSVSMATNNMAHFLTYLLSRTKNNVPDNMEFKADQIDKTVHYLEEWVLEIQDLNYRNALTRPRTVGHFLRLQREVETNPDLTPHDKKLIEEALLTIKQYSLIKIASPGFIFFNVPALTLIPTDNFFYKNAENRLKQLNTHAVAFLDEEMKRKANDQEVKTAVGQPVNIEVPSQPIVRTIATPQTKANTTLSTKNKVGAAFGIAVFIFGVINLWNPLGWGTLFASGLSAVCMVGGAALSGFCLTDYVSQKLNRWKPVRYLKKRPVQEMVPIRHIQSLVTETPAHTSPIMTPNAGNCMNVLKVFTPSLSQSEEVPSPSLRLHVGKTEGSKPALAPIDDVTQILDVEYTELAPPSVRM